MGLEKVVDEVLSSGKKRAENILKSAEKDSEQILSEARNKAEEMKNEAELSARKEMERIRKQQLSIAEIEAKKIRMEAERRILDEIYDKVRAELSNLPGDENERIVKKLIERGIKECPNGVFYSNRRDLALLRKMGVRVGGEIGCIGGIVIESEDGSMRIDYTYDRMLEELWKGMLREVHKSLR